MSVPTQGTVRALNTNNNKPSFYPNDNKIDQFIRKLKFEPMEYSTDQFEYHRASSLPTVTFFGQGGTVNNNVTAVSTETDTFARLGQTCSVDLLDEISSRNDQENYFSQLEQQVRGAKLSILRTISESIIFSSTNIIGLLSQVITEGNGVSINMLSSTFVLDDLYRIANASRSTDDFVGSYSGRYFISNERALRQVMHLLDDAGRTVEFKYDEELQTEIPIIFGIPWLISDAVPTVPIYPNDYTYIFVAQLEGKSAIRLLYAKDSDREWDRWGIGCFDVPLQQTTSQISKGVFGFYSLLVPESSIGLLSLVRIDDAQALP